MSYTVKEVPSNSVAQGVFPDFEDALTLATELNSNGNVWAVIDYSAGEIDALVYNDTVYVRAE